MANIDTQKRRNPIIPENICWERNESKKKQKLPSEK